MRFGRPENVHLLLDSMRYIKSPLNYIGGKYKLLPQIIPLIQDNIETFVDLFGGGFNVGINVECKKIIYNDINVHVVDLLRHFYDIDAETIHRTLNDVITQYDLNREFDFDEEHKKLKYLELRKYYNDNPSWILFYALITCSFSNQIRFNSKGEFNLPYGKRYYNPSLQEKLKVFVEEMHKRDIEFFNNNFREFDFSKYNFFYADPPYFNSVATYNENGGWTEQDEIDLLHCLDIVNKSGKRFALSNNLKYGNPILDKWKEKYNVHYLNGDYSNCNYQKKDKSKDIEVLITNY